MEALLTFTRPRRSVVHSGQRPYKQKLRPLRIATNPTPERNDMSTVYGDFDISDFWDQSKYADQEYVDDPLTNEHVESVEHALGYTFRLSLCGFS